MVMWIQVGMHQSCSSDPVACVRNFKMLKHLCSYFWHKLSNQTGHWTLSHTDRVQSGHSNKVTWHRAQLVLRVWDGRPFTGIPSCYVATHSGHSASYPQQYRKWVPTLSCPGDIIWAVMIAWRIRGKIIRSVPCCIVYDSCTQWYTHIWAVLTVDSFRFRLIFVCLFRFSISCVFCFSLDYFVLVLFAFCVGLVYLVLLQEIGWEERLRNDLVFCVEWDVSLNSCIPYCVYKFC